MNASTPAPGTPAAMAFSFERFQETAPEVVGALRAITKAVEAAGLDKALTELVKIRVSQINGCAFCTQFHVNAARKLKVEGAKLDLLAAWREAPVFSPRERAALGWAEHLTHMATHHDGEQAKALLRDQFSEDEAAHLTVAIAGINAWNRIAGGLSFPPPAPQG